MKCTHVLLFCVGNINVQAIPYTFWLLTHGSRPSCTELSFFVTAIGSHLRSIGCVLLAAIVFLPLQTPTKLMLPARFAMILLGLVRRDGFFIPASSPGLLASIARTASGEVLH
jgi:hypothetical protein